MNDLPPIASPIGQPSPTPPDNPSDIDLLALAQAQKWFSLVLLANLFAVLLLLSMVSQLVTPYLVIGILLLCATVHLLIALSTAIFTWNLARTLDYKWPWLPAGLCIFPCIDFIVIFVLNSQATTKLQRNGYRVGFLGAKLHAE